MYSTSYSCQILKRLEFPQQISEKCSKYYFQENPYIGRSVVMQLYQLL